MAVVYHRDPVRLMRRRLIAVVLLIVLAVFLRGLWSVYQKEQESRLARDKAQEQYAELERRKLDMQTDIARLQSDRGMEAALRESYELGKEGEGVVVIVEPEEPEILPTPSAFKRLYFSLFPR